VGTVFETRCSYDCDYCYNYLTTYNVIQVQMNQLSQKYHLGTEHYAASPVRGDWARQHVDPTPPVCAATPQLPTDCLQLMTEMMAAVWQVLFQPSHIIDTRHQCNVNMTVQYNQYIDNIRVIMIVWRLRGNIIKTALCQIVWHSTQSAAHLCEQFLPVQQIWFVILGPLRCA